MSNGRAPWIFPASDDSTAAVGLMYCALRAYSTVLDAPYSYVELIRVNRMDDFMAAVGAPAAQDVAAQFREFADGATFMVTESIE